MHEEWGTTLEEIRRRIVSWKTKEEWMSYRNMVLSSVLAGALVLVALVGTTAMVTNSSMVRAQTAEARQQAQRGEGAMVRQVTVVGEGKVYAAPDTAQIQIGVETEEKTAQEALEENNLQATEIISKLKELEIAEKDIQTSNFSIHPTYDEKGRKVRGYRVSNTVSVKIRNLSSTGELLDEVVQVGANSIYGISFSVEDPSELMDEAREKAMDDASARARQLARSGDASLGQVLVITENIGSSPEPMPRMARAEAMDGMGGAVPIESGEQTFSTRIQVTFELE